MYDFVDALELEKQEKDIFMYGFLYYLRVSLSSKKETENRTAKGKE